MNESDVFRRITTGLNRCGIPYMLSGSFACAYYGAPRSTRDIDIVIEPEPEQLQAFVQGLPATEYYSDWGAASEALNHRSLFNVIDLATGWKIDLILRKDRRFSCEEFQRRRLVNLHGLPLFVASAEDVIIAKLEWSKLTQSPRQIEDVAGILRIRSELLDRAYLQRWITELQLGTEWREAQHGL